MIADISLRRSHIDSYRCQKRTTHSIDICHCSMALIAVNRIRMQWEIVVIYTSHAPIRECLL